ncbi:MAG TPA: acyl-CoA synthetase [Solirubrobacteraceae bacterium]|nr:acyl-CoA synthetase [Solirubrobacteraceae bacterium]
MLDRLTAPLFVARTFAGAGLIHPERPDRLIRALGKLRDWGPTIAGGYQAAAARRPDAVALVDERGTLTFREIDERSNRLAHALRAQGIGPGDGVAVLARNHRWFIDVSVALAKLGSRALYLNTMFAAPQITDVCEREEPVAIVHDEEFAEFVAGAAEGRMRFVAWHDGPDAFGAPTLDELAAGRPSSALDPPDEPSRVIILTSGTTGTPKGAQRRQPDSLTPVASLFDAIPLKARQTTMIAAPMFHSWGMAHFLLALTLGSTLVVRRRFDPEDTLAAVAHHRATALAVVPVMLQRIMELPDDVVARYDTSALRVVAVSGSALPGDLATKVMDRFGDVVYNLYGSTEVAWATIAGPKDLRAAPGCAGRPPHGTVVRLYDDAGLSLDGPDRTGRIFVGNEMAFEGYTGGGGKDVIDGLMSTGDVGHFDAGGRLFIDGRDDEMIVSGGENVFPREVEDLLADHPCVVEAAVIGVPDADWGDRLSAYVVAVAGMEPTVKDLKDYVKENLAGYKVPRDVVFLDELPRNATGKVLKRMLGRE